MNTYLIQHKIRTLAAIWSDQPFFHGGYEFRQWEFLLPAARPEGEAWIARKEVSAVFWVDAINTFRADLFPILDRVATVSQCYTMAEDDSFLVLRKNKNAERIFFLRYNRDRPPVPLSFNKKCIEALDKLDALGDKMHALSYLREATNAPPFLTRLVMLLAALEALAGEKSAPNGMRRTNMGFIRDEILRDRDLYDRLYEYGKGLRHAILHGKKLDLSQDTRDGIDYIDRAYRAIVRYLNDEFGLEIDTRVLNPQRVPHDNYERVDSWLKPQSANEEVDLRSISKKIDAIPGHLVEAYDAGIPGLTSADPPSDY